MNENIPSPSFETEPTKELHRYKTVRVLILNSKGEVLMQQKGKDSQAPYHWEFPGGKMDPGYSQIETAVIECRQETGIDL
jgi:8-oxo-dGTP pyrophosphatase MutT (NUDIX family)